jgi:hypothetical protein
MTRIAAMIPAITGLVPGPPNLIGFDFADLRVALVVRKLGFGGPVSLLFRTKSARGFSLNN